MMLFVRSAKILSFTRTANIFVNTEKLEHVYYPSLFLVFPKKTNSKIMYSISNCFRFLRSVRSLSFPISFMDTLK